MGDFAEKIDKTHVAFIAETVSESIARDLSTVCIFLALWSFGYFVGSPALEWVGALIGLLVLASRGIGKIKKAVDNRMTPEQARKWLDKRFPTTTRGNETK